MNDFDIMNVSAPQVNGQYINPDDKTLQQQIKQRFQQDTKQRNGLVIWLAIFISIWFAAILTFIYVDAGCKWQYHVSVINTLLVTTSFDILGLAYIVFADLFPAGKNTIHRNAQK